MTEIEKLFMISIPLGGIGLILYFIDLTQCGDKRLAVSDKENSKILRGSIWCFISPVIYYLFKFLFQYLSSK